MLQEKLKALVWRSKAFKESPADMEALWDSCSTRLYSLEERQKQLGLGNKVSTARLGGTAHLEGWGGTAHLGRVEGVAGVEIGSLDVLDVWI